MTRSVLLIAFCALMSTVNAARAADPAPGWPDVELDPSIPTLEEVVGHAPGTRITSTREAFAYIEALAAAAPDRARLVEYARSWEGRPLVYLLVGSAQTITNVESIKNGMQQLADPDHWLSAGVTDGVNFMIDGSDVYAPLRLDQGWNALRFAPAEELAVGGHLWAENREQWAWKPAVMVADHGAGLVIGFVADPTFRAALDGANIVFLNAVLRAPGQTDKLR